MIDESLSAEMREVIKGLKLENLKQFLQSNGLSVNVTDIDGRTLLHEIFSLDQVCIWRNILGYFKMIEYLLQNGADINAQNNEGYTPFDVAPYSGRDVMFRLLKYGAQTNNPNIETVSYLSSYIHMEFPGSYKLNARKAELVSFIPRWYDAYDKICDQVSNGSAEHDPRTLAKLQREKGDFGALTDSMKSKILAKFQHTEYVCEGPEEFVVDLVLLRSLSLITEITAEIKEPLKHLEKIEDKIKSNVQDIIKNVLPEEPSAHITNYCSEISLFKTLLVDKDSYSTFHGLFASHNDFQADSPEPEQSTQLAGDTMDTTS